MDEIVFDQHVEERFCSQSGDNGPQYMLIVFVIGDGHSIHECLHQNGISGGLGERSREIYVVSVAEQLLKDL